MTAKLITIDVPNLKFKVFVILPMVEFSLEAFSVFNLLVACSLDFVVFIVIFGKEVLLCFKSFFLSMIGLGKILKILNP